MILWKHAKEKAKCGAQKQRYHDNRHKKNRKCKICGMAPAVTGSYCQSCRIFLDQMKRKELLENSL